MIRMMMLSKIIVAVLIVSVVGTVSGRRPTDFRSDAYIEYLNGLPGQTWTAGRNFDADTPAESLLGQLGLIDLYDFDETTMMLTSKRTGNVTVPIRRHHVRAGEIPDEFDSRKQWPRCTTIGTIRDQGSCGSCWAFGATETMSDRICIASNQTINVMISAEDLLECCGTECGNGCQGGYAHAAWQYWTEHGIVTGGLYGTQDTCKPYSFEECEHRIQGRRPPCKAFGPTPECHRQCSVTGYKHSYDQDKYYGASHHNVFPKMADIQKEILLHGPIQAGMRVYDDFFHYKSGVYEPSQGSRPLGGHAIKIIGWGVENGTPYWMVANSWNEEWGDQGFFKIRRGANTAMVESNCHAGLPKL